MKGFQKFPEGEDLFESSDARQYASDDDTDPFDSSDSDNEEHKKKLNHLRNILGGSDKQSPDSALPNEQTQSHVSTPSVISPDKRTEVEPNQAKQTNLIDLNKSAECNFKSQFKMFKTDSQQERTLEKELSFTQSKIADNRNSSKASISENEHLNKVFVTEDLFLYVHNEREVRYINRKHISYSLLSPDFLTSPIFKDEAKGKVSGLYAFKKDMFNYVCVVYDFGVIFFYEIEVDPSHKMKERLLYVLNSCDKDSDTEIFDSIVKTAAPFINTVRYQVQVDEERSSFVILDCVHNIIIEFSLNTLRSLGVKNIGKSIKNEPIWTDSLNINQKYLFFGQNIETCGLTKHVKVLLSCDQNTDSILDFVLIEGTLYFITSSNKLFKYSKKEKITEIKLENLAEKSLKKLKVIENYIFLQVQNKDKTYSFMILDTNANETIVTIVSDRYKSDDLNFSIYHDIAKRYLYVSVYICGTKELTTYLIDFYKEKIDNQQVLGSFKLNFQSPLLSLACYSHDKNKKLNVFSCFVNSIEIISIDIEKLLEKARKLKVDTVDEPVSCTMGLPASLKTSSIAKDKSSKRVKEKSKKKQQQNVKILKKHEDFQPQVEVVVEKVKEEKGREVRKIELPQNIERVIKQEMNKHFEFSVVPALDNGLKEVAKQMKNKLDALSSQSNDKTKDVSSEFMVKITQMEEDRKAEREGFKKEISKLQNQVSEMSMLLEKHVSKQVDILQQTPPMTQTPMLPPHHQRNQPRHPPHRGRHDSYFARNQQAYQHPPNHNQHVGYHNAPQRPPLHRQPEPQQHHRPYFNEVPERPPMSKEQYDIMYGNGRNNLSFSGDSTQEPFNAPQNVPQIRRNDSFTSVTSLSVSISHSIKQSLENDDIGQAFYLIFTQNDLPVNSAYKLILYILHYLAHNHKLTTGYLKTLPKSTVLKVFDYLTKHNTAAVEVSDYDLDIELSFIQHSVLSLNKEDLGYYTTTIAEDLLTSLETLFEKFASSFSASVNDKYKIVTLLLKTII